MERERLDKGNFLTEMNSQEKRFIAKSTLFFGSMTMLLQALSDASLNRILIAGAVDALVGMGFGAGGVFVFRKIKSRGK